VCQDLVGKRPLPLGEGLGEGLAMKPKIPFLPFLFSPSYGSGHKRRWESLFLLLSYALTPVLSQTERELTKTSWHNCSKKGL